MWCWPSCWHAIWLGGCTCTSASPTSSTLVVTLGALPWWPFLILVTCWGPFFKPGVKCQHVTHWNNIWIIAPYGLKYRGQMGPKIDSPKQDTGKVRPGFLILAIATFWEYLNSKAWVQILCVWLDCSSFTDLSFNFEHECVWRIWVPVESRRGLWSSWSWGYTQLILSHLTCVLVTELSPLRPLNVSFRK